MSTRKHKLLTGICEGTLALILWFSVFGLLGLKQIIPPGLAGFVGSAIVFAGCFSLAKHLTHLWKSESAAKRESDLYTQVLTEIEAEKRIKTLPNNSPEPSAVVATNSASRSAAQVGGGSVQGR